MVELLFFAYRDFTGEPDAILRDLGFGRAHHRVLHFVNRNPGLRVADLLEILRITKQSLARVLKQLVAEGYVAQERPASDRRERRLHLTPKGADLANRLLAMQTRRISRAIGDMSPEMRLGAQRFLLAIVGDADRADVWRMISRSPLSPGTHAREDE
jgi:DNA-binding MarR family transcriptional regulator